MICIKKEKNNNTQDIKKSWQKHILTKKDIHSMTYSFLQLGLNRLNKILLFSD